MEVRPHTKLQSYIVTPQLNLPAYRRSEHQCRTNIDTLRSELRTRSQTRDSDSQLLSDAWRALEQAHSKCENEKDDIRRDLQRSQDRLTRVQDDLSAERNRATALKQELRESERAVRDRERDLSAVRASFPRQGSEDSALRARFDAELQRLATANHRCEDEKSDIRRELQRCQDRLVHVQDEASRERSCAAALGQELREAERTIRQREHDHDAYRASLPPPGAETAALRRRFDADM